MIGNPSNFDQFSERTLTEKRNQVDFDSAIPRFESWRPSQFLRNAAISAAATEALGFEPQSRITCRASSADRARACRWHGRPCSRLPPQFRQCRFEDTLRALELMDRSDPVTSLIAKKIIELARLGERDPARLRQAALQAFSLAPEHSETPPTRCVRQAV